MSASELFELLATYRHKACGSYRTACPYCDRPKDTALRVRVERDHVHGRCYRCEAWAIYRDEPREAGERGTAIHGSHAPATEHRTLSDYGRELWRQSRDLAGEAKSERILQSIIELAHFLRLAVVAVGVADEAAAARLKELGCDYMQADFKGPAVDPQGFVERFGFSED